MNNRQNAFAHLVNRAVSDSKFSHMRNAIEKELLIYNILFCFDQHGLFENIVFKGGALLRLGHGGERLNEDLEFVAGADFAPTDFSPVKLGIEDFFFQRYGLTVEVKEPKKVSKNIERRGITVNRWRVNATMYPERKETPKQHIKIEFADVSAYTKEIVSMRTHYDVLPDGYDDVLIVSETLNEVLADKLVLLPANSRCSRYCDIWDLYWLIKRRAEVNTKLVEQKIIDYHSLEYADSLNKMIERLPDIVNSSEFHTEMQKLLPSNVFDRTLRKDKFCEHLLSSVQNLFEQVRYSLN